MPAATNKADLFAIADKEYRKLNALLEPLEVDIADKPGGSDALSIKQIIGHRVHWMAMFLRWCADGEAGRPVHIPAEGYKWNQLKPYNAGLYEAAGNKPWPDVLAEFQAGHADLMAFLQSREDAELYTPNVHAWTGKWTLGRWAEASSASHYRSAAKYVRQVLREAKAETS